VLILLLQERLVLDMSSISGEWTAQQMNLYLQMSREILLALLIIYFTQVYYLAMPSHFISFSSSWPFYVVNFCGFSGFIGCGIIIGAIG
jgi:hypothetical protein